MTDREISEQDIRDARAVPVTDLKTFTAMLDRAGVVYGADRAGSDTEIEIAAGTGPHNEGYSGFVPTFVFSSDGSLMKVDVRMTLKTC